MLLTDTHCHLHFPEYEEDRTEVIRRARDAGIGIFINVGTDRESSQASVDLARHHEGFYASAGVHPHDAKDANSDVIGDIHKMLQEPEVIAIGEVGLDFFRNHSPRDVQESLLRQFAKMHRETGKPLIIHCRNAYENLIALLKEESSRSYRGIIHCFSSGPEDMHRLLELGFHISFAGPLTYKKNDSLREACRQCPAERLLLETDAPFLPPQSIRGKRNEPYYLLETARLASELRGISLEGLAEQTTANANGLLGL